MNRRYRPLRPEPRLYRPAVGLTSAQRAEEQDAAAGSRQARILVREDGSTVLASVALRCYSHSRRVYAYLRWASGPGRTSERYLGDVSDSPDRAAALQEAWTIANSLDNAAPAAIAT